MFFGHYEHSLDDKGRLLLPRKIKEELKENSPLYVLKGFEGCLSVYREAEFLKLTAECEKISFNKKNARDYLRTVLSSVIELPIDKVNRIQLPKDTLSRFHITKNVTIIGVGDHFEIWDSEAYNKYEEEVSSRFESIAESLGKDDEWS